MGLLIVSIALIIYFTQTASANAEKVASYKAKKQAWLEEDRAYLKSRRQA